MGRTLDEQVVPVEQEAQTEQVDIAAKINSILEDDSITSQQEVEEIFNGLFPDGGIAEDVDFSKLDDEIKVGVLQKMVSEAGNQLYGAFKSFGIKTVTGLEFEDAEGDKYILVFGRSESVKEHFAKEAVPVVEEATV